MEPGLMSTDTDVNSFVTVVVETLTILARDRHQLSKGDGK
jgi:hypothetical protein